MCLSAPGAAEAGGSRQQHPVEEVSDSESDHSEVGRLLLYYSPLAVQSIVQIMTAQHCLGFSFLMH